MIINQIKLFFAIILISTLGYSQKQIKTSYTKIEHFYKRSSTVKKIYTTYSKIGTEKEIGTWEYIGDLDKYKKTPLKTIDVYTSDKKILSRSTLIENGHYKGLEQNKTIYYYNSKGDLNRKTNYISRIDTIDVGYEEFNKTKKVSPEYIIHNFIKDYEEYYKKGKLEKRINFAWFTGGEKYYYNEEGVMIKKEVYDFWSDQDALSLLRDNYVSFKPEKIKDTHSIKYTYDDNSNWVTQEVYNSKNELVKKETRVIEYY